MDPIIQIGLLTDATGMPLMISAYEGNTAETKMMIPTLKKFMATHGLSEVIIVADAGMISEANWKAIEAEGFSFILGQRLPHLPYVIEKWQRDNPGTDYEDGQVWAAREPVGTGKHNRADHVTYYQWKSGRARRTLDGIDKQVTKAAAQVAGRSAVKRNRFIKLEGAAKSINRELEAKARSLAGLKAYLTNIPNPTPDRVIGSYQQLYRIEKSFRMAKTDLAARPVYHHLRESIEAHLTIVFAALAIARWLEATTGVSIKTLVKTLRRHRTIDIQAGDSLDEMIRKLGRGLFVIELMGQGVNYVTGDYSRGAAGFWVENGRIAYPVEEITIAGNLCDMLRGIVAVGADAYASGSRTIGSVLIDRMMVAGH